MRDINEEKRRIAFESSKIWPDKKGRDFSDGPRDMSFILFTGGCIETWNLEREDGKRRCTNYEIFVKEETPPDGQKYPFRYPKVSDDLFDKLANSEFPPPLLAVATSDVIPLNIVTKGERFSSSKKKFAAKVKELIAKPAGEGFREAINIAEANSRGETNGKTVSVTSLSHYAGSAEGLNLENIPDDHTPEPWEGIDEKNGWHEPDEKPQTESQVEWNPKNVVPGTKVQNIEFFGGFTISRRMAHFWRKKRADEYFRCCEFLRSLLKKPWPRSPSSDGMAFKIPMLNALLKEDYRRKQKAAAETQKTA